MAGVAERDAGGAPTAVAEVKGRLDALGRRIAEAGGDPARVTIVGVTKTFGPEVVRSAVAAGLCDLGENYAAELVAKATAAAAEGLTPRWHFIGAVQRNKVRSVAPYVHLWHGVTRAAEGVEIARWSPGAAVLVQVDISGEATKNGVPPDEAAALVDRLRELDLDVRGLMGIAAQGATESARGGFRLLAGLARQLELVELSMGMTDDVEVAVQEGATIVRVGRALFGPRPSRSRLRE
ncbi:MAG TPA: YggS family pyridoxal phosphate-dependent enzyme [Acidimicrobiales bacterium]